MRIAVVDVGNTSTSIALYADGKISRHAHITGGILQNRAACAEALAKVAAGRKPLDGIALASVVPRCMASWQRLVKSQLGVPLLSVNASVPMPIRIDYPKPESIGADRLADAVGAVDRYGAPVLICDFGTALTFDLVTPEWAYIGGAICPGLPLMRDYLAERTAQLPRMEFTGPTPKVGRSTEEAMRLGAQIGYCGMVREITSYLTRSTGYAFKLIATGGYAAWALRNSGMPFEIDPYLTLRGLGVIWSYAQNADAAAGVRGDRPPSPLQRKERK